MNNVIALSHVNKKLGEFAIQDLNLAIPEGMICGLVGENGAGKSTTIRMLMGALLPDSGEIYVLGENAASPAFCAVRDDIGIVMDEAYFPEVLNPVQVGRILQDTYRHWDSAVYAGYLKRFQLPERRAFKDFSRGMRMKLAIATALSHHPRLLILDEATAGLDPIIRDEVLELFSEFTREENHSILISSHILSDLEKLCDYIAFLHEGRLLFCEEKDTLQEQYGLFTGAAELLNEFLPEAIVAQESNAYGGARALIRRGFAPEGFTLERPCIEDIILFLVKGAKSS